MVTIGSWDTACLSDLTVIMVDSSSGLFVDDVQPHFIRAEQLQLFVVSLIISKEE